MTFILFEGALDFLFFKSFFIQTLKFKTLKTEEKNKIKEKFFKQSFFNILNFEDTSKIYFLKKNNEKFILLSTGSKEISKEIMENFILAYNILKNVFKNNIKVISIFDSDASKEILFLNTLINDKNLKNYFSIFVLEKELEDLILNIYNLISKKRKIDTKDKEATESIFYIIEKFYRGEKEKIINKRKVSALHTTLGYRCYAHLFDKLFKLLEKNEIDLIKELQKFLNILQLKS